MAMDDLQTTSNEAKVTDSTPAIPDYVASPNAVFKDEGVQWRYGRAPDYSKTRKVWEEGRRMKHTAGSLEEMVENLVKNWEVEASFKPRLQDWRTIDHEDYSFAMGNGPPMSAEHMIKVGTYNGIITPNEYYSPENSDFASSHKTFKRMMPTFAWEVLEVYSGPPTVTLRWRHWGYMKNDYVGFNNKGEKVTAKAHGGIIDIEGVTIATVDDKLRMQAIRTYMDPLEMFRQIAPNGIVNKQAVDKQASQERVLDDTSHGSDGITIAQQHNDLTDSEHKHDLAPEDVIPKHDMSHSTGQAADAFVPHQGTNERADEQAAPQTVHGDATSTNDAYAKAQNHSSKAQMLVDTAAELGAHAPLSSPPSNYQEALVPRSEHPTPSSSIGHETGNDGSTTSHSQEKHDHVPSPSTSHCISATPSATNDDTPDIHDATDEHSAEASDEVHPQLQTAEHDVGPAAGEAVVAAADSEETTMTHEEMSRLQTGECPFLMNRE